MQETEVNIETEEEFAISENGDGGSAHTSPEALRKIARKEGPRNSSIFSQPVF